MCLARKAPPAGRTPEPACPSIRSHEAEGVVRAPVDAVFAHIDDPVRLSAHMSESSWIMAGSRMSVETDEGRGQAVGSTVACGAGYSGFGSPSRKS